MKADRCQKRTKSRDAPHCLFFIETIQQPVSPQHPAWSRPLPLTRGALREVHETPSSCRQPDASISVGDYFGAVRSFLLGAGQDAISAASKRRGASETEPQLFRIFLAKHGEYYHPARVETESEGRLLNWVVNVAVSSAGKSLLLKEYAILKRLNREFPVSYLPEVYAASEVDAGRDRSVALFLGEWLSGFHEFHLTRNASDFEPKLVLWDTENGRLRMDSGLASAVYQKLARILTYYFNLFTFEGISAWHHAAGDFVVKISGNRSEVRLITVRDYRPLFQFREETKIPPDIETILQALLIFLLNLGIRTRLDRLDGTGEMAWSDPVAVEATVAGVLDALAQKPIPFELPLPMDQLFRRYLAVCAASDLLEISRAIAAKAFPTGSPEHPLLQKHLKEHTAILAAVLGRL